MLTILILSTLFVVALCTLVYNFSYDQSKVSNVVITFLFWVVALCVLIPCVLLPMRGGYMSDYGIIEQTGYMTHMSEKGLIWKTKECELQKGISTKSTVYETFKFSATNPEIVAKLKELQGSKKLLKIKCRQWFIMPFSRGMTDREIIEITILGDS